MKQRIHRQSAALILSLLALAGCSPSQVKIPENLTNLQAQEVKDDHIKELKSWIFPPQEAETARHAFVSRCVAARDTQAKYQEANRTYSLDLEVDGQTSTDYLKKYGYLPSISSTSTSASSSATSSPASSANTIQALAPTYNARGLAAYTGNSANGTFETKLLEYSSGKIAIDGCLAQSYQYIYGSLEDGLKAAMLAPSFAQAIKDEVLADENYKNLQKNWSQCMSDKGFANLTNTGSARDLALQNPGQSQKILQADISCRESNDYENKLTGIQNKYYEAVYQRVQKFSDQLKKIHETALQNVAKDKASPQSTSKISLPSATNTPSPSAK